jgi:hypothetical protein
MKRSAFRLPRRLCTPRQPARRQHFDKVCLGRCRIGEFRQHPAKVLAHVGSCSLGAGDHRHDRGDFRAALLAAEVHPVLPSQGDRAHLILTRCARPAGCLRQSISASLRFAPVVVDLDASIAGVHHQFVPLAKGVVAGFPQLAGGRTRLRTLTISSRSVSILVSVHHGDDPMKTQNSEVIGNLEDK